MADKRIAPKRNQPLTEASGTPTLRTAEFLELLAASQVGTVDDLAGGASLADVIAKVNELLAAMEAAGVML